MLAWSPYVWLTDAAPVKGEGVNMYCSDQFSTEAWCRGRTPIRNDLHDQLAVGSFSCHPADVNYTTSSDNPEELFGNFLSGQMCPVINERTDRGGREALGGDSYGYYGAFDSQPGSSIYDDPRDYREWCDWSDVEDDDKYYDPVPTCVDEEIVTFKGTLGMVSDAAVVTAVLCSDSNVDLRVSEGPGLFDNVATEPGPRRPEPGVGSPLSNLSDFAETDFMGPSPVVGDASDPPVSIEIITSGPSSPEPELGVIY